MRAALQFTSQTVPRGILLQETNSQLDGAGEMLSETSHFITQNIKKTRTQEIVKKIGSVYSFVNNILK